MATTSIWRVKGWLGKVVIYVENPDKTDNPAFYEKQYMSDRQAQGLSDVIDYAVNSEKTQTADEAADVVQQFVSGVNCHPGTAREEMLAVKRQFGKEDGTVAYHGYQSFAPGEATPKMAHEIGVKLAKQLWGEKYQVIVATHRDKSNHLHNHFVVNTVSFLDGIKYHRTGQDYRQMREASDALCREYGLSVIENKQHGKSYKEWLNEKEGKPTVRGQIREDINQAIKESFNYGIFIANLEKRGYLIKDSPSRTYIALKPPFGARFIRLNSLGEDYTKERIIERLSRQKNWQSKTQPERTKYYPRKLPQKRRKITGLQALYLRYVYLLKLNRKPKAKLSPYLWEDLCKFEKYRKEYLYLKAQNITSKEELNERIAALTEEVEKLKTVRKPLYEQKRRGDNIEQKNEIELKLSELNSSLKELRRELRICNDIAENTAKIKAKLELQKQENEITSAEKAERENIRQIRESKGDENNEPGERRG